MAQPTTPKKHEMPAWDMQEEIVISGVSGRWPESDNIDELRDNLYNHVDMITEDDRRWPVGLYGLPTRSGKIKDLSKFDAQFFGVHGKQANLMDPQARMLLELTYEALCDAGVNPQTLRGSRTGVYVGACVSEVEEGLAQDVSKVSGYALTGCSRSMFANRISYTFDFQGPSYAMDTACSSSFLAFQQAILGLRSGQCDQAVVGGVSICLRPVTALQFHKLGMLSPEGKCKFLDSSANGYARSEACCVIFLQKKELAKRIYATVVHTKTNTDGYKKEGITFPSREAQRDLMEAVYAEAKINPLDVNYVEAHGTGTKAGDPEEINAITEILCPGRKEPLLIGGVKTNLGHAEPASGLCSLAKVLITFENKSIPANLHFENPNTEIEPLVKGVIKPVNENTPYGGGIAGVNSFGFGGVNVHAILKSHDKEFSQESKKIIGEVPRLVLMCGRTEESVNHVYDFVEKNPERVTREFLALLGDISKTSASSGMNYRGLMLMKEKQADTETYLREINRVPEKRPLWFVYSGMGSQWAAMAKALMPVEIFARAIHMCADILKPYKVDLLHLLLEDDEAALDTTVAPFVAIAAVQIGLTDVLRACGIEPDGIVGHSVGELGCAYGDGLFNPKQMMLSAYWRGKCVEDAGLPRGLMAAVGLSWEECLKRCPEKVWPACHNSEDSVTISGDYTICNDFVESLKAENVFARGVKSCDVAFHSPYVHPIAKPLLAKLQDLLPERKLRSPKWICSSATEDRWNDDSVKYSAPEYYVNNLTSPVLFHGAVKYVPKNAICIEIAPHTLLQAILKRSLGSEISYVGLMKRANNDNNLDFLFQSIGKLYTLGLNPDIENLYPKVPYPVPKGTQSVGSLIKWDHSQNWLVTQYPEYFNPSSSSDYIVKVDIQDNDDAFLSGHCIDGRLLYPATGYLMLAWKMLAKIKGQFHDKLPVEFENVTIQRATLIPKSGQIKFIIRMMETSGEFSISEGSAIVATGRVFVPEDPVLTLGHIVDNTLEKPEAPDTIKLQSKDIYRELKVRGYDYGPTFQGLIEASSDGTRGTAKWMGNWISFADTMLQMAVVGKQHRALFLPVRFQAVRCDPRVLQQAVQESTEFPIVVDHRINVCVTRGIEMRGIKTNIAPRRIGAQMPVLDKCEFTPYNEQLALTTEDREDIGEYLQVCASVARKVLQAAGKGVNEFSSFKEPPEATLHKYLEAFPDKHILLKSLNALHEAKNKKDFAENLKNVTKKYGGEFSKDLLSNIFAKERFIRPIIDTVAENSSPRKISVLEINNTSALLNTAVTSYLHMAGSNVDYTICHPSVDELSDVAASGVRVLEFNASKSKLSAEMSNLDLVLYKDMNVITNGVNVQSLVESIYSVTKDGGFLLGLIRTKLTPPESLIYSGKTLAANRVDDYIKKAESAGFVVVSRKSDSATSEAILLRKLAPKKSDTQVINITSKNYNWVDQVKEKLKENEAKPVADAIWLLASDAPTNGIIGLVNCLRYEPGGDKIKCIFNADRKASSTIDLKKAPYSDAVKNDLAMNVYQNGKLGSFRHTALPDVEVDGTTNAEHAFLNVTTRGDLSTIKWFESANKLWKPSKNSNEIMCHVYYAPLNFRDVMLASGKLPPDALPGDMALHQCILGLEFAGRDSVGKRIMGMVPSKGLATTVLISDPEFTWPIPDNWSMEEASTVPVAYATAYYSLVVRGGLQPGESVLIHSGSGGVGQAAISICLSMGCQVFTTVGSKDKREFLKKEFPQLKDRNFAYSRDTSFEQHVLRQTTGRGVDLVLNSLSEEKLHASVRCLAQHGRFLEIGKYDLSQNNPLGMSAFLKNIAFHGILLDSLFVVGPNVAPGITAQKQMVTQLIKEGIKTGAVKPLKGAIYDVTQAENAFRFMASGKHMGKIVIKLRDEESAAVVVPKPIKIRAISRTLLPVEKSYIITGGLGGFGLELAHWLVDRGARNLVLTSRSGPKDAYQNLCLKRLRAAGVKITVSKWNQAKLDGAKKIIDDAKALGPVGGVFNLAAVLSDAIIDNQTVESFETVCATKVDGTLHLDKLTRESCPELDYFVVFSSVSSGRGNAGQTNYGYANSVMERVCELRRSDGLHGIAVQWGAIGDVGMLASGLQGNDVDKVIVNTQPQRIISCLNVLDRFIQSPYSVCLSAVMSEVKTEGTSKKLALVQSIAHILGVKDASTIHSSLTLGDLGMDSLMGIEIKQTLERDYDLILSMHEIRAMKVNQLQEISKGNLDAVQRSDFVAIEIDLSVPQINIPTDVENRLNDIEEGKPVFFLPPIEGVFVNLEALAKLIKRPVIGLNWTKALIDKSSITEVAKYYIDICKRLCPEGNLDLVGYSFGAVVAFEMSLQLKSKVSNLILLDGSPKQIKLSIEQYAEKVQVVDPDEQEVEAMVTFLMQLSPIDYRKVRAELLAITEKTARHQKVWEIFVDNGGVRDEEIDIAAAADSFFKKMKMMFQYEPSGKFSGNPVLIRAEDLIVRSAESEADYDYGMSAIVNGECEVHAMKGNHKTFISNNMKDVSSLINEKLKK